MALRRSSSSSSGILRHTTAIRDTAFTVCFCMTLVLLFASIHSSSSIWSASASSASSAPSGSIPDVTGIGNAPADSASSSAAEDPESVLTELKSMLGMEPAEMKHRLSVVFDFMDTNKDGELSDEEVKEWIGKTKEAVQKKQVLVEMETIDKDGDKKVTFEEMQAAYANADGESVTEETLSELRKRFNAVDKNKDSALSLEEIALLMNPGKDEELMKLEVEEILTAQDKNKDRKISVEEFLFTEEQLSEEDRKQYEAEFRTYDLNGDGFIDEAEIRKVVAEPHQQEITESAAELRKLASDGKLTKDYWQDKFHKFVISGATDNGELLRFPTEYNLGLPFEDIPKMKAEEEEPEHEEL